MCPRVRSGDETIIADEEDETGRPLIIESLCVGCGICVNKCPFGAITITNTPEAAGVLTHQYGQNGFRLFGLPGPREGSVVGILGVNGIGKSTAIKILSRQEDANMGNLEKTPEWREIIEAFRGNEVQAYLEKLASGAAKTAYKPQYVDILTKMPGTVKDALSKVSKDYLIVAKELELENILSRKLKNLSGGELQRVAIAVAMLRDVDLYFFDEPTSFLDISQRLKVAKRIRALAKTGKSVVAVEHDLIILDYLSDYINIAFGEKGAFGVLSKLKNTRVGINEFLSGKLRTENVRIRDYPIHYEVTGANKFSGGELMCKFPKVVKDFGEFSFEAEAGEIHAGTITGILGPNATGKTTFMKILTGALKNDGEDIDLTLDISYKPQYIEATPGTVRDVLKAATPDLYKSHYKTEVLEPMGLEPFLDRELGELSGGELQRVAIAECISRDADIYFLDEPSAYLDVEQRLIAARMIRRRMENSRKSAIVIDHDIGFIDYISDRIMVFSGEPGMRGFASTPKGMRAGMNEFLKLMEITFRRDEETKRPRANKLDSQKDKEQRAKGEYYYN